MEWEVVSAHFDLRLAGNFTEIYRPVVCSFVKVD